MSRYLAGLTALTLVGAAALPLQATAAERHAGISNHANVVTDMSARRWYHRRYYAHRYWGPRYRYWGPRYGYYGPRYSYYGGPYYGYGYPYYRPRPFVGIGVGPFGFVF
jgi:hypothetical protein